MLTAKPLLYNVYIPHTQNLLKKRWKIRATVHKCAFIYLKEDGRN